MPMNQVALEVNSQTELSLIESRHSDQLFSLIDSNREHLRPWHPWVDTLGSASHVEKSISNWQQQYSSGRACYYGIWHRGQLCGMVNYVSVDWSNQWAALSYWLDAGHQGKGIMTASCSTLISQAFDTWKFNRISIECAAQNTRSRAVAKRLGFELEGIIRGVEWLHDHYADHAMYGLLRLNFKSGNPNPASSHPITVPWLERACDGRKEEAL
jgi:ribosomal-protein-serine acetyltransferase